MLEQDTLLPLKSKLNVSNDPPWISQSLKKIIRDRQAALARGDDTLFKSLRNQVNRERKSCRGKFYSSKVEYLKTCSREEWWKEAKKLSSSQVRVDTISLLRNLDCGSENNPTELEDLSNMINKTFLEPTKDFDALHPETGDDIPIENIRPYHVSEMSVSKKLANLIKTKATCLVAEGEFRHFRCYNFGYSKQLLPRSESPSIVEMRRHRSNPQRATSSRSKQRLAPNFADTNIF
jgi:hypothetical protein